MKRGKKIFNLLASILEYPTDRIAEQVHESIEVLKPVNSDAAAQLELFRDYCVRNERAVVEELYIYTFDLNGACCPYVGHHLFGDDQSRILFAARLKEYFPSHVAVRKELPDHIALILRSLVVQDSVEEAHELVRCLIPAVKKMIGLFQDAFNPYRRVLRAVLLTLIEEDKHSCSVGRYSLSEVGN